jgi:hypothetical protein
MVKAILPPIATSVKPVTTKTPNPSAVIIIRGWKPYRLGTLAGYLDIELPGGLVIHGCALLEKDGDRWISLPSKQRRTGVGAITWVPTVSFPDRATRDEFQSLALAALDAYLTGRAA